MIVWNTHAYGCKLKCIFLLTHCELCTSIVLIRLTFWFFYWYSWSKLCREPFHCLGNLSLYIYLVLQYCIHWFCLVCQFFFFCNLKKKKKNIHSVLPQSKGFPELARCIAKFMQSLWVDSVSCSWWERCVALILLGCGFVLWADGILTQIYIIFLGTLRFSRAVKQTSNMCLLQNWSLWCRPDLGHMTDLLGALVEEEVALVVEEEMRDGKNRILLYLD